MNNFTEIINFIMELIAFLQRFFRKDEENNNNN